MKKLILSALLLASAFATVNQVNAGWGGRAFGLGFAGGLLGGAVGSAITAPRYGYNYGYYNYPYYSYPSTGYYYYY